MVEEVSPKPAEALPDVEEVARWLENGDLVIVPTDTIYGIACRAGDADGVRRIYEAKGRGGTKPLAICVADAAAVAEYADVSAAPAGLIDALLPGPLTLVLPSLKDPMQ